MRDDPFPRRRLWVEELLLPAPPFWIISHGGHFAAPFDPAAIECKDAVGAEASHLWHAGRADASLFSAGRADRGIGLWTAAHVESTARDHACLERGIGRVTLELLLCFGLLA